MQRQRDYADIRKADWRLLGADELGAVVAKLARRELYCRQLSVRNRLRRRRLEAVALFENTYGPLTDRWFWARKVLPTPKFETKALRPGRQTSIRAEV